MCRIYLTKAIFIDIGLSPRIKNKRFDNPRGMDQDYGKLQKESAMKKYLVAMLAIAAIATGQRAAAYTVYGPNVYMPAPVVYYVPNPPIARPYPMAVRYYNAPARYAAPRYGRPYGYYGGGWGYGDRSYAGDIASLVSLGLITGSVIYAATR